MSPRKARTVPLDPSWLKWWRELLGVQKDVATMSQPRSGSVYTFDRQKKEVVLVACAPDYQGSMTDILNQRCLKALGYTTSVRSPLMTETEVVKHLADGHKTGATVVIDIDSMTHAHPWFRKIFTKVVDDLKSYLDREESRLGLTDEPKNHDKEK